MSLKTWPEEKYPGCDMTLPKCRICIVQYWIYLCGCIKFTCPGVPDIRKKGSCMTCYQYLSIDGQPEPTTIPKIRCNEVLTTCGKESCAEIFKLPKCRVCTNEIIIYKCVHLQVKKSHRCEGCLLSKSRYPKSRPELRLIPHNENLYGGEVCENYLDHEELREKRKKLTSQERGGIEQLDRQRAAFDEEFEREEWARRKASSKFNERQTQHSNRPKRKNPDISYRRPDMTAPTKPVLREHRRTQSHSYGQPESHRQLDPDYPNIPDVTFRRPTVIMHQEPTRPPYQGHQYTYVREREPETQYSHTPVITSSHESITPAYEGHGYAGGYAGGYPHGQPNSQYTPFFSSATPPAWEQPQSPLIIEEDAQRYADWERQRQREEARPK